MKKFYKKQYRIVTMLVLTMLFQIIAPVAGGNLHAIGKDRETFQISNIVVEDEKATVEWSLELKSNAEAVTYTQEAEFTIEEEQSGALMAETAEGKIEIGDYTVSKEGIITVNIHSADDILSRGDFTTKAAIDGGDLFRSDFTGVIHVQEAQNKLEEIPMVMFDVGTGKELRNIFTNAQILIDGKAIVGDTVIESINNDTNVQIGFDWSLSDTLELAEGDWSKIKIPKIFASKEVILPFGGPLAGSVDGEPANVGTYTIDENNDLIVVFDETLVGKFDRSGTVGLELKFDVEELNKNIVQIIEFGEAIDTKFAITVKPTKEMTFIKKTGILDSPVNATYVDWEIDVNTKLESLTNAIVEDTMPVGFELNTDSLEIRELTVGYDGSLKAGEKIEIVGMTSSAGEFRIPLGQTKKAYRIKYKTNITQNDKKTYINNAILKDGVDTKGSSKVTIGKLEQGTLIEKSGKLMGVNDNNKNGEKIVWTIDVNQAQAILNNVEITDAIPPGLEITGIKKYKIKFSNNKWVKDGQETPIDLPAGQDLSIVLGNLNKETYRIEVETKVKYGQQYDEYTEQLKFENTAILNVNNKKNSDAYAEVTVYRDTLLGKTGEETTSYGVPQITWTISVNKANHYIENAVIKDTIGLGLKLKNEDSSSFEISDSAGNPVTFSNLPGEYPSFVKEGTNFNIEFGNIHSSYTVKYVTDITDPTLTSFENSVTLAGDGLKGHGIVGGEIETGVSANIGQTVNNTYTKKTINSGGYDGLNYEAKTMSWVITVDAKKEKITQLTITDSFSPLGSMVFLEDTFKITKGGVEVPTNQYKLTASGKDGFVLKFIDSSDNHVPLDRKEYKIYYKTSFNPDAVIGAGGTLNNSKKYVNQAVFSGKTVDIKGNEKPITATQKPEYSLKDHLFNSGQKIGMSVNKAERTIDWEIYVNALGQNLKGSEFVVTDALVNPNEGNGHELALVDGSGVEVEVYSLKPDGSYKKENITSDTWTITSSDKNGFVLTFTDGIDKPHKISFTTKMVGESVETYKNQAVVTSDKTEKKTYPAQVTFTDYKKFITKTSDSPQAYKDDIIHWTVTINKSLSHIPEAVFIDEMTEGLVYLKGSLKLYKGAIGDGNLVDLGEGNPVVTPNYDGKGGTRIKLALGDIKSDYMVTYDTVVVGEIGANISNSASLNGTQQTQAPSGEKKYTVTQSSWGTGSGTSRGQIEIIKKDAETGDRIKNNPAEFQLYYYLNGDNTSKYIVTNHADQSRDGFTRYGKLPYRTYYLEEKTPPTGYVKSTEIVEIVVDGTNKDIKRDIKNTKIKIDQIGKKIWSGGPAEKPSIELQLYRHVTGQMVDKAVAVGSPVTLDSKTFLEGELTEQTYTWEGLDKTNIDGKEYIYSVKESNTPINYTSTYNGLTVTNTYVIPKTEVTGKKLWAGGPAVKPDIKLQLKRNGNIFGEPVTLQNGITENTWTDLDETDADGNKYEYTIDELDTPKNYGKSRSQDKLSVTNTYQSPVSDITATKIWENGPATKPTIQLQLYRDNEPFKDSVELKSGTYEYVWKDLAKTDENAKPYVYTVKEVGKAQNYDKVEEGLTVTNTYVIPKTQITGNKEWIGGPSNKPTIELQLYKDGEAFGNPVALADGKEQYTWTDLDKTDINGKEHVYTVDEVEVPRGYNKFISGDGLTVINTFIPDDPAPRTGSLTIKKTVSGSAADRDKKFSFTVEFDNLTDYLFYTGEGVSDGTIRSGDTIELAHGQSITIKGIAEGTRYKVSEEDYSQDGYLVTESGSEGSIKPGSTSSALFKNTKDSEEPVDPEDPDPTDPTDPEDPNPTDPESPDPTDPADPDSPGPTDPADPDNPDPTDPTDPTRPTDPPRYERPQTPDPNDPDSPNEFILIDENGVPRGTYIKKRNPDGTYIYVDKDGVPLGSILLPKTGDDMPVLPLIILFIMSLFAAISLMVFKKKRFN